MSSPADLRSNETRFWHNEIAKAVKRERKRCADIALAIDSGRGNEKEIARAILLADSYRAPALTSADSPGDHG